MQRCTAGATLQRSRRISTCSTCHVQHVPRATHATYAMPTTSTAPLVPSSPCHARATRHICGLAPHMHILLATRPCHAPQMHVPLTAAALVAVAVVAFVVAAAAAAADFSAGSRVAMAVAGSLRARRRSACSAPHRPGRPGAMRAGSEPCTASELGALQGVGPASATIPRRTMGSSSCGCSGVCACW